MQKNGLRIINAAWWRFFWRYAVLFAILNIVAGLSINYSGQFFPRGLYAITLFYGLVANLLASLLAWFYCLNRKFKKSDWVLQTNNSSFLAKTWAWLIYFWRFILLAFAIGFLLGALLPTLLKYTGFDPVASLKYAKYLGSLAVLPASWLAFASIAWRKESRQTLRVVKLDKSL